ncbi:MAG: sigma-54-dependent transcriptional regulator [Candidatus Methylacidiphilales bacterium]|nr:sigma-54 dependent transcriptional regulator [Candidatus Methylacidiphilales bacterium]
MPEKILIVDDTPVNIRVLTETLEPHGYELFAASSAEQCLKLAGKVLPHLILLDVVMPGRDGFEICGILKKNEATRDIPVLFVTAKQDTESILRGFRTGAVDYISKPFRAEEVVIRVETHLKIHRLSRELTERNRQLETEIARRESAEAGRRTANERLAALSAQHAQRWGVAGIVGESPGMRKIQSDIQRLHQFPGIHVLITGESGTGKELVARAIHYGSPRSQAPFIAVNCAAIPADLAESTLFGHTRGAFTGATSDRKGCFELADSGTLFLDEVGDMEIGLQAKLLRVLEDGEITPIGASRSRRVDVRVVAATNAEMSTKIAAGGFRSDLYYRLARYTVETYPLREHPQDIPLLAQHFLNLFASEMGMHHPLLSQEARESLERYPFPGNVRELKNIIERALIESGGGPITPRHLYLASAKAVPAPEPVLNHVPDTRRASRDFPPLPLNLRAAEEELIQRALREADGNVSEAARLLGVNRSRIYRRGAEVQ